MRILKYFAAIALMIACIPAFAIKLGPYVGLDYQHSKLKYEVAGIDGLAPDIQSAQLTVGYQLMDSIAFEARYMSGLSSKKEYSALGSGDVTTKFQGAYGFYAKGFIPTGIYVLRPYAIGGYTNERVRIEQGPYGATLKNDGFSYGGGIDLPITDNLAANVEYMRYLNSRSTSVGGGTALQHTYDAVNLGVQYRF